MERSPKSFGISLRLILTSRRLRPPGARPVGLRAVPWLGPANPARLRSPRPSADRCCGRAVGDRDELLCGQQLRLVWAA